MKYLIPFKYIKESLHFDSKVFDKHDMEIVLNVKDMLVDLEDRKEIFDIRFFQNRTQYGGLTINISTSSKIVKDDIYTVINRIDDYLLDNDYIRDDSNDSFRITFSGRKYIYKAYYQKTKPI